MSAAVKRKLSGSTDGKSIKLTQTASDSSPAPETLHTAVADTTPGTYDEIWLWAYNGHASDVVLTIEEGAGDDLPMQVSIPYRAGWVPIEPGFILQNGVALRAFAAVANVIKIRGHVNAITD